MHLQVLLIHGVIWYAVFLFSTTCHEAAHALAAKLGGDETAALGGQASLDPFPHVRREPFGMIVVPVLSYFFVHWMIGWASAPYDPQWQRRYPRRAAWMALAGPGANFLLVLLAAAGIRAGIHYGMIRSRTMIADALEASSTAPGLAGFTTALLGVLFVLNLILGTFNLLPFPPLDGNTGITLLMSQKRALQFLNWTQQPGWSWIGLVIAWVVFDRIFIYVVLVASLLLHS